MRRLAILVIVVALVVPVAMQARRVRTTHNKLNTIETPMPAIEIADSDSVAASAGVDRNAVSLFNFNKRASDTKESFHVRNNLQQRISSVRLLLRYTALDGTTLHERTVTVPIDLKAGETKMTMIKSFDTQRLYYYYKGTQPRKQATPFKVAVRVIGYDIPVGY